jgi:antitoxin component of RelBE/YafQ-DinJ toxin-antitoxin module
MFIDLLTKLIDIQVSPINLTTPNNDKIMSTIENKQQMKL